MKTEEKGVQFLEHSYHSRSCFEGGIDDSCRCSSQNGTLAGGRGRGRDIRVGRNPHCGEDLVGRNRRAEEAVQRGEDELATC